MAQTAPEKKPWYENREVWGVIAFWVVALVLVWEVFFAKPPPPLGPGKQTISIDPSLQRLIDQKARENERR